ncbi:MAG: orotidine-5'-phosphate decarboxylase [Acidobacteriota bacterium]
MSTVTGAGPFVHQMPTDQAKEKLIVALDLESVDYARRIVKELDGVVDFFKIGLVLQLAPGCQAFIEELIKQGKRVFLDYKFHDIPETVRLAVERASDLGVSFLTIHGSSKVMKAAVAGRKNPKLKLFTVTVLTSMDSDDIAEMGYSDHTVAQLVMFRAQKAMDVGCDGVISSAKEAAEIKAKFKNLLVITPGIRPDGSPEDDQKRRMTPAQAIQAGADYLVLGRPITQSELHPGNPRRAAEVILEEMQMALDTANNK